MQEAVMLSHIMLVIICFMTLAFCLTDMFCLLILVMDIARCQLKTVLLRMFILLVGRPINRMIPSEDLRGFRQHMCTPSATERNASS